MDVHRAATIGCKNRGSLLFKVPLSRNNRNIDPVGVVAPGKWRGEDGLGRVDDDRHIHIDKTIDRVPPLREMHFAFAKTSVALTAAPPPVPMPETYPRTTPNPAR